MFKIYTINEDQVGSYEQLGTKPKFWFQNDDNKSYLFKESRQGSGEHWAEKVACELCGLLDLPHAKYELAMFDGKKGTICPNFVPDGAQLIHGNQLLQNRKKNKSVTKFYHVKEHKLNLVLRTILLSRAKPPIEWEDTSRIRRGIDIFVGYLMLDAWIANQDRHHENWGLIYTKNKEIHLAPTFDHASSLGRNESDKRRKHKLTHKGRDGRPLICSYVERAYSAFYSSKDSKRLSTMKAFEGSARRNPVAGNFWINRLQSISDRDIKRIFESIPKTEISKAAVEFAMEMLRLNSNKLLEIGKTIQ